MSIPLDLPVVEQTEEERLALQQRVMQVIPDDPYCEVIAEVLSRRPDKAESYIAGQVHATNAAPRSNRKVARLTGDTYTIWAHPDYDGYDHSFDLREYETAKALVTSLRLIHDMRPPICKIPQIATQQIVVASRILYFLDAVPEDLSEDERIAREGLELIGLSEEEIGFLRMQCGLTLARSALTDEYQAGLIKIQQQGQTNAFRLETFYRT